MPLCPEQHSSAWHTAAQLGTALMSCSGVHPDLLPLAPRPTCSLHVRTLGLCHVLPGYCQQQPWLRRQPVPTASQLLHTRTVMVHAATPCVLCCAMPCHAALTSRGRAADPAALWLVAAGGRSMARAQPCSSSVLASLGGSPTNLTHICLFLLACCWESVGPSWTLLGELAPCTERRWGWETSHFNYCRNVILFSATLIEIKQLPRSGWDKSESIFIPLWFNED